MADLKASGRRFIDEAFNTFDPSFTVFAIADGVVPPTANLVNLDGGVEVHVASTLSPTRP